MTKSVRLCLSVEMAVTMSRTMACTVLLALTMKLIVDVAMTVTLTWLWRWLWLWLVDFDYPITIRIGLVETELATSIIVSVVLQQRKLLHAMLAMLDSNNNHLNHTQLSYYEPIIESSRLCVVSMTLIGSVTWNNGYSIDPERTAVIVLVEVLVVTKTMRWLWFDCGWDAIWRTTT